jgi:hypothetical protein
MSSALYTFCLSLMSNVERDVCLSNMSNASILRHSVSLKKQVKKETIFKHVSGPKYHATQEYL